MSTIAFGLYFSVHGSKDSLAWLFLLAGEAVILEGDARGANCSAARIFVAALPVPSPKKVTSHFRP